MRAVSPKRAALNRHRRAVVDAMYEAQPWCSRCGTPGARDDLAGHERLSRAQGGDLTQPDVLLCHPCNTWCEDEPILAAAEGWKISKKWGAA